MNTVQALLELYVSLGGKLTDSYPDISDGVVGDYTVIPNCIKAVQKVSKGGKVAQMHFELTGTQSPFVAKTDMNADEVISVVEAGGYVIAVEKDVGTIWSLSHCNSNTRTITFNLPNVSTAYIEWDEPTDKWLYYNSL